MSDVVQVAGRESNLPEPWMRGTLAELDVLPRAVIHALELAEEDVAKWCGELSDEEMRAQPLGVRPVADHLRHIEGSLDRLLTYADGQMLSASQMEDLKTEPGRSGSAADVLREFRDGVERAKERVRAFAPASFADARKIGRKQLPSTVGGILFHCAEHAARHVGQVVTTVKVVKAAQQEGR